MTELEYAVLGLTILSNAVTQRGEGSISNPPSIGGLLKQDSRDWFARNGNAEVGCQRQKLIPTTSMTVL